MIACNIRRNNRDFLKVSQLIMQQRQCTEQKRAKRSTSQTRNPLAKNVRGGSSDRKNLRDDDWELSCTIEQKAQQIQRSNKNLDNR